MCYNRQSVTFVNHVESNTNTGIVSQFIPLNSGLWPNLLRQTAITTNFYFPFEEEGVCTRKNSISVNNTGHNLASFLYNSQ